MIDLVGKRFGKLTVVAFDRLQNHKTYWKCVCDCGLTVVTVGNNLRTGNTKSCGCIHRERVRQLGLNNTTHGESHGNRTRLYTIWCGMRQRCSNPNRTAYRLYGGKGIKVCDEWNDFAVFKEWAIANGYTDTLTIDRIDPHKGYNPDNCRWISASENTARANRNHTTRRVIRGEGLPKVSQPQRIDGEKI